MCPTRSMIRAHRTASRVYPRLGNRSGLGDSPGFLGDRLDGGSGNYPGLGAHATSVECAKSDWFSRMPVVHPPSRLTSRHRASAVFGVAFGGLSGIGGYATIGGLPIGGFAPKLSGPRPQICKN